MTANESVILEQSSILCGLGSLEETVTDLFDGASAIVPGPTHGLNVPSAPFKDETNRGLAASTKKLLSTISLEEYNTNKTVFIFCSAKGDLEGLEQFCEKGTVPSAFLPLLESQALFVKEKAGISNARTVVISNACASGAIAVLAAHEFLQSGKYDTAVLFGYDAICKFVVTGFNSLAALSPSCAKPFDKNRDGLTLGDGAALAVLVRRSPFQDDIIIAGAACSNDANHRTGPSRTGEGLFRAARAALQDAHMSPLDIGAVKCHGTATNYNDAMEAKAIVSLFAEDIPPCFSMKGALGHTSGAGSLMELCIAAECLRRRLVPPTCGFAEHGVDEPVPISASVQPLLQQSMLCLSAGFGGINAGVVIKEHVI